MPTERSSFQTAVLTALALIAFASNSILCRLALAPHLIDAGSFTFVRLLSGAFMLTLLVIARERRLPSLRVNWISAFALFAYAIPFSFAYLRIPAGVGALILFGAVQATMIGSHIASGNRLQLNELFGLILALIGLASLAVPGAEAPDLFGTSLMAIAGVAWGMYSLRGKGQSDPLKSTASNFLISILFSIPFVIPLGQTVILSTSGILLAVMSGAVASGIGYAIWYTALRGLSAAQAGVVQLLVPVLAAYGGIVLLDESVSLRLMISGAMIFSGVTLAILQRGKKM